MPLVEMEVEIDDEILPLITEMRKMGLITVSCCSAHPEDDNDDGIAYVSISMKNIDRVNMFKNECGRLELVIGWKRRDIDG